MLAGHISLSSYFTSTHLILCVQQAGEIAPDIGYHFGSLLDSNEGVDVILNVGGESFHAHKLVLAARSSVFRSKLFDEELDGEKNEVDESDVLKEIVSDF